MNGRLLSAAVVASGLVLHGCAGESDGESAAGQATGRLEGPTPSVMIVSPADGDTIEGDFQVRFRVRGVALRPAGLDEPGAAHLHVLVDQEVPDGGAVIPAGGAYLHLGQGQDSILVSGLGPGSHTLIAVLGDFQHRVIEGGETDSIRVIVTDR